MIHEFRREVVEATVSAAMSALLVRAREKAEKTLAID